MVVSADQSRGHVVVRRQRESHLQQIDVASAVTDSR